MAKGKTQYVAIVYPPRGAPWVEYIGAASESAAAVDAQADAQLCDKTAPYPHYCRIQTLNYTAAVRAFARETRIYLECVEYETRRAEALQAAES